MHLPSWQTDQLFDLSRTPYGTWLTSFVYPWEALPKIKEFILQQGPNLDPAIYEEREPQVWIAKSAKIHPSANIAAPCIIGERCELRPGAYLRGAVLVGNDCVLGNSCEFKNCILLEHVQVPHFSYVGDSILGNDVHFGAGVITSNFRQDKAHIRIHFAEEEDVDTQLRKIGAIVGDGCEIGCQAVLNPGSMIGRGSRVYPLTQTRRALPAQSILKNDGSVHSMLTK
ncbi:MAG: UDP-N-acetylglucosamine pyrophosphorylase [Clostridia bacterium]|nr:UDP-N-acetylglucosamine pyrophosphorylase [Clostridia bacterium]